MPKKNFGDFLKYQRKRLGISQESLADQLRMDRSYLSMLERRGNPTFQKMIEIIEACGLTILEFFHTSEKEAPKPTIVLEGDLMARKDVMKNHHSLVIIPVLSKNKPLTTKIVTAEDVETYIMLDKITLEGLNLEKLVAIRNPDPSVPYKIMVIDISAEALEDGGFFLTTSDGAEAGARISKVVRTQNGYILEGVGDEVKPESYFGRQIDKVRVLGKIAMVCATI